MPDETTHRRGALGPTDVGDVLGDAIHAHRASRGGCRDRAATGRAPAPGRRRCDAAGGRRRGSRSPPAAPRGRRPSAVSDAPCVGRRGLGAERAHEAEHDERPFEADADVAEAPGRAAHRRLVPHPGEGGERRQHVVDRVDRGAGRRRTRRSRAATFGEHSGRCRRAGTRRPMPPRRRTSAAARRAAASRRRSRRRARPPAALRRPFVPASPRAWHRRCWRRVRSAAARRRPPSALDVDEHRVLTAAAGDDAQRPGDRLGALGGPTHPEQRIGGPRRNRAGEVDLRQRRDDRREGPAPVEHPDVLDDARRRARRVVARFEHPPVAAGHDRDAVRAGHGVEAQHHRRLAELAATERRERLEVAPSGGLAELRQAQRGAGERRGCARPVPRQRDILDHAATVGVGEHDAAAGDRGQHTRDTAAAGAASSIGSVSSSSTRR